MQKPGELPQRFWSRRAEFLLTPNNEVYEKDGQDCWLWENYKGRIGRDATLPPTSWTDLVKDRSPLVRVTHIEAAVILALQFTQEVYRDATQALNEHRSEENPHYRPGA